MVQEDTIKTTQAEAVAILQKATHCAAGYASSLMGFGGDRISHVASLRSARSVCFVLWGVFLNPFSTGTSNCCIDVYFIQSKAQLLVDDIIKQRKLAW